MMVNRYGCLKTFGISLLLIAAVIGALIIRSEPRPPHSFFLDYPAHPLVIAHQGGDGLRPSNTMVAFDHAVEIGVDVLELDIHGTADGEIVIIHDATIDRTTNGSGRVNEMALDELQSFDAGYYWPTLSDHAQLGEHPYRGQGIIIPTLEELLQAHGDMPMVIEIKQREPSLAQPFCELLQQYDMTDRVVVAAFSQETLDDFRDVCPTVITSGAESEIRFFYILHRLALARTYQSSVDAFQVPEYSSGFHLLTPRFVRDVRYHGVDVHAWTINDVGDMERMIDLDVDGIMTDYPDQLLTLLGR